MIYIYTICFILLAVSSGCECVPDITGPKKIEPAEAANVAFINNLQEIPQINIESGDFILAENISSSSMESDYKLVPSGINNLKIKSNGNEIFRIALVFEKDKFYTAIIDENGIELKEDSAKNKNMAYYRISEAFKDAILAGDPTITGILSSKESGEYPLMLKYEDYSTSSEVEFKENHLINVLLCRSKVRIIHTEIVIPKEKLRLTPEANCGCN